LSAQYSLTPTPIQSKAAAINPAPTPTTTSFTLPAPVGIAAPAKAVPLPLALTPDGPVGLPVAAEGGWVVVDAAAEFPLAEDAPDTEPELAGILTGPGADGIEKEATMGMPPPEPEAVEVPSRVPAVLLPGG
jgi:hypothetical protein